jgi:very-short-patch-repair endonuclease
MTKHYNKKEIQNRRRYLRNNMTCSEKLVWMFLRKQQMNERFLRQYSVDNYIIDFYCPKLKLAIEIDGDVHDLKRQKRQDKTRQEYLEKLGIKFVRIKNEDLLNNPNKAFERIENKIKEEPLPR